MEIGENRTGVKVLALLSFILMIAVNALANLLPINGITTAEVSDMYENLFAPAGFTFAIWGLIYLLLLLYTLYLLGLFRGNLSYANKELSRRVGILFSISSLANTAWIFCWHYDYILLSTLLMAIILLCLIFINRAISAVELSARDSFFIKLPFQVYFGWITVAAVANITVLLVSLGWNGFSLSEELWTVVILIVAALIGAVTSKTFCSLAYGAVLIWAYTGILVKHISPSGYSWEYPAVVITAAACLILLIAVWVFILLSRRLNAKNK